MEKVHESDNEKEIKMVRFDLCAYNRQRAVARMKGKSYI